MKLPMNLKQVEMHTPEIVWRVASGTVFQSTQLGILGKLMVSEKW